MPELGRHRVLDRQRVDVARRQREDGRQDAANYLEEAPLRVRVYSDWRELRLIADRSTGFRVPRIRAIRGASL